MIKAILITLWMSGAVASFVEWRKACPQEPVYATTLGSMLWPLPAGLWLAHAHVWQMPRTVVPRCFQ